MGSVQGMDRLTPREKEIAESVSRGLTNREIAVELGISPETVKRHLATVYDKLGIRSRVVLALQVVAHAAKQRTVLML